jgi:hypothetical protein
MMAAKAYMAMTAFLLKAMSTAGNGGAFRGGTVPTLRASS